MAMTFSTKENVIKKTFCKRFKHAAYSYGLKKDLIIRLELNSYEKVNLCNGDTAAIYKLSNISLKNGTIFDERYATMID